MSQLNNHGAKVESCVLKIIPHDEPLRMKSQQKGFAHVIVLRHGSGCKGSTGVFWKGTFLSLIVLRKKKAFTVTLKHREL